MRRSGFKRGGVSRRPQRYLGRRRRTTVRRGRFSRTRFVTKPRRFNGRRRIFNRFKRVAPGAQNSKWAFSKKSVGTLSIPYQRDNEKIEEVNNSTFQVLDQYFNSDLVSGSNYMDWDIIQSILGIPPPSQLNPRYAFCCRDWMTVRIKARVQLFRTFNRNDAAPTALQVEPLNLPDAIAYWCPNPILDTSVNGSLNPGQMKIQKWKARMDKDGNFNYVVRWRNSLGKHHRWQSASRWASVSNLGTAIDPFSAANYIVNVNAANSLPYQSIAGEAYSRNVMQFPEKMILRMPYLLVQIPPKPLVSDTGVSAQVQWSYNITGQFSFMGRRTAAFTVRDRVRGLPDDVTIVAPPLDTVVVPAQTDV